jgi:response regulator of citrate/malate metabolism
MKNELQYKIVVLDDNSFYNRILTKRIKSYAEMLSVAFAKDFQFDIHSYTNAQDCIKDLEPDTDLLFLDYFLDNKINAPDLLQTIKKNCADCKLVIISQAKNIGTVLQLVAPNPVDFIYKDEEALSKSCMILDDMVSARN